METEYGCFYVDNGYKMNWNDAELACQQYNSDWHLATLDTQQVSTFMVLQCGMIDRTNHGSMVIRMGDQV